MVLTTAELEKYADVLLWGLKTARKSKFKKGDIILIQYENPALPLAEILFKKIVAMGMHPVQRMGLTFGMEKGFFEEADDKQLVFIPPGEKELYENVNGRIFLRAPESLTHLKDIDPARIGTVLVSRKPLKDILDKREEQGFYSWTLCTFPTHELAWQAKTTIRHYAAQIIKACYLDKENPVQEWESILNNVHGIKKWLNSLKIMEECVRDEMLHVKELLPLVLRNPAIGYEASNQYFYIPQDLKEKYINLNYTLKWIEKEREVHSYTDSDTGPISPAPGSPR